MFFIYKTERVSVTVLETGECGAVVGQVMNCRTLSPLRILGEWGNDRGRRNRVKAHLYLKTKIIK